jgi:hypothetical protein
MTSFSFSAKRETTAATPAKPRSLVLRSSMLRPSKLLLSKLRPSKLRPSGEVRRARAARALFAWAGLLALLAFTASSVTAQEDELSVTAAVEKTQVYAGQPFVLQIQVTGSDEVKPPDLSGLEDFQVQDAGGGQNNSQSISIVNGKISRVVRRGYTFNFRLTAKRAGDLLIPAINVTAEGTVRRTQPIRIRAVPPSENEDFKLRLELSDARVYVGQPVVLTVTWYVGGNVEEFGFNIPLLEDKRFDVTSFNENIDPNQQDAYVRIPLGDDAAIGRKGRATLDGRSFLTVKFEKVLIPKQAGTIPVSQATVSMRAVQGVQRRGGNSVFDEFFSDGIFGRRAVYEDFVVPSNTPTLEVAELPAEGRPAGFNGLIGPFKIEAAATPTDVSVGDPITLTVKVEGPRYLENVTLPPLENQPSLARDFRIPEERATGVVRGGAKVFTQTLRATHSGVSEIPPIEVPYFDPRSGAFEIARSEPILLKVEGNRIITAQDAEGRESAAVTKTELEARQEGIAHNYDGADALINHAGSLAVWLSSPLGLALLIVPPLGYGALWGFLVMAQRRGADPTGRRAKRAYRDFNRRLASLDASKSSGSGDLHSELLEALREYLGGRFALPPGALTFADVGGVLQQRGAGEETLSKLRALFEQCEAGRYAGGLYASEEPSAMIERARQAAGQLERELS